MTTISLDGLDARAAGIADQLSKAQALIAATDSGHPALTHIAQAGQRAFDLAVHTAEIYSQYVATDRRGKEIVGGQFGVTTLRTYIAAMSFLREACKYVPEDEANSLRARIDTLLWLGDSASTKADAENLILTQIVQERARQDKKHGEQTTMKDDVALRVTLEEFGEVAKAMNEHEPEEMEKELIETAACIVKWLSARYRNRWKKELEAGYTGQANKPQDQYGGMPPFNPATMMGDMA